MLAITWRLLLWLIPIGVNIYADRKGRKPHYLVVNILRAMAAIVHGGLFVNNYEGYWYYWWPVLLFQVTSYWILFELGLNLAWNYYHKHPNEKRPLLYYDNKEKDSGWIDRFFSWAGKTAHTATKILVLLAMIYSIILIFQRGVQ